MLGRGVSIVGDGKVCLWLQMPLVDLGQCNAEHRSGNASDKVNWGTDVETGMLAPEHDHGPASGAGQDAAGQHGVAGALRRDEPVQILPGSMAAVGIDERSLGPPLSPV